MSNPIIRVENLGKKYRIRHEQPGQYVALRDVLAQSAKGFKNRLFGTSHSSIHPTQEDFWALKDVSFEVKQGDRVGIIGRNGAGKSTLLKILSRITEPTSGFVEMRGRVASLLEVGTGFHPELTGRENIFLNGAILGMGKNEIHRKFDEIVAFAEVERFLDTPVKRYSSGMYVRLAFAVAAHLEPEILIIDEVLAVGDFQFQKKCLSKMEDVGKEGRTVIFVSHQMGTITQLCNKGIYLNQGSIVSCGDINNVVKDYVMSGSKDCGLVRFPRKETKKPVVCRQFSISNQAGAEPTGEVDIRYPFYINLDYEVIRAVPNIEISIKISTSDGRAVLTTSQSDCSPEILQGRAAGVYRSSIEIPEMFLMPSSYMLTLSIHEPMIQILETHENCIGFSVLETGSKFSRYNQHQAIGIIIKDLKWSESAANLDSNPTSEIVKIGQI